MANDSDILNKMKEVGNRTKVRIRRRFANEELTNGFIVAIGKQLVILQQWHDFYCEGYIALRIEDVVGFRSGKYERFFERILSSERLLTNPQIPFTVNPDSMVDLLRSLQRRESVIILHNESIESKEGDEFYLGKIVELNGDVVSFLCLDALGMWDTESTNIRISKVSTVEFETPYANTLSRYSKTRSVGS